MSLVRFLPAVFVFGLAALGYWLTAGGTQLPQLPQASGSWFASSEADEVGGLPDAALVELFRFDTRPQDLGDRWTRQSNGGSGTVYQATLKPGDLAIDLTGSVLYHFSAKGQLRRVVIAGTTTAPQVCGDYAVEVLGFEQISSEETSAVLKGSGAHRGQLRMTALASAEAEAAPRCRVEWTVENP